MVVGIHDGHNASAAVLHDGRLIEALQEERLTRTKNQGNEPRRSLAVATRSLNGERSTAYTALNGLYLQYDQWQREKVWGDYERAGGTWSRIKQRLKGTPADRMYQRKIEESRERRIEALGFPRDRIIPVEHHTAHASAAYYGSGWTSGKTLVFTCDGSGDRLSATVSIGENGKLTRIAEVSEHDSIGRLYSLVTFHLGMLPLEHEYKVMGLAGYVTSRERIAEASAIFDGLFEFDRSGLVWRRAKGVPSMYAARGLLRKTLAGRRFDVIAAAAQTLIERMLSAWVRNAVREAGIHRIACAGGVFMNVKANLAVLGVEGVEEMFVFPSCGDESNAMGAAWAASTMNTAGAPTRSTGIGAMYFGEPITDHEAESALRPLLESGRASAEWTTDIEARVAEAVAAHKIVARAKGPMEFGARALGNRSILARADRPELVPILNGMVKNRDFWMPFAPSVLAERGNEYYEKPKPVSSPYMMFAFASKQSKRHAYPASQHVSDGTTRPHEVHDRQNPDYYRLLKLLEERTGEGIVLNTSFNLHGEPIVYRASDAVDVFSRSGLEYMALGNWWVEKRKL